MNTKIYICLILCLSLIISPVVAKTDKDTKISREYQIKSAFIYNFINFVEWPEEKTTDSNELVIVGIAGSDDLGRAFEKIKGRKVRDKSITLERIEELDKPSEKDTKEYSAWQEKIGSIRNCHVLFFGKTVKKETVESILKEISKSSVLTVGESDLFLESGGIVNFTIKNKKVRFEINIIAATDNGLKIRSKLLKLADRVIMERSLEKPEEKEQQDNAKESN